MAAAGSLSPSSQYSRANFCPKALSLLKQSTTARTASVDLSLPSYVNMFSLSTEARQGAVIIYSAILQVQVVAGCSDIIQIIPLLPYTGMIPLASEVGIWHFNGTG